MTNQSVEIFAPEINATVKIVWRDHSNGLSDYDKKTRVHVWGVDNLPRLVIANATLPQPKPTGEDPENDKAYRSYNATYGKCVKDVGSLVFDSLVYSHQGLVNLRFSRKAGCDCGCSPGLIAERAVALTHPDSGVRANVDFYVTLHDVKEPTL